MVSPFSTLSPRFLFKTIPTAKSILLSLVALPAPSSIATIPKFSAWIFLTTPLFSTITGTTYLALGNKFVLSIQSISPP